MAVVRRQEGRGNARNLARAPLNWASQGQRWVRRFKVRRRAERVSLPAMEKKRRRRVLVVTVLLAQTAARRPACQVVGDHLHRQPGAVGGEASPRGDRFNPTPYLRSRMAFSISDFVAPMVRPPVPGLPRPVSVMKP